MLKWMWSWKLFKRYFIVFGVALTWSTLGAILLPGEWILIILVPALISMELTNRYLIRKENGSHDRYS